MTREVTIAALQIPAVPAEASGTSGRERNFNTAVDWLERAGHQSTDVACIGETVNILGAKLTPDTLRAELEGVWDETIDRFGSIARRHAMYVIAPIAALFDGIARNAALILDRHGNLNGWYFKVHCTESERALGIVPGESWPTFSLDFGKIGIQICHDNSFPESARCLALNGAEIIFWPHTMSGWGDAFMDVLLRGPAVYNGVYHVPACFGCDPEHAWRPGMLIGHSSIIAPDGIPLTDAGRRAGMALTRIDLDLPRIAHDFTRGGEYPWRDDMRHDRRPEVYTPITRLENTSAPDAIGRTENFAREKP
jgi:predicted amidohydrolase